MFNFTYNFNHGFSKRSGSDNKCCLKFFNCGKIFPLSMKNANQLYFCSISGNSISAWGNDHPVQPNKRKNI